MTRLEIINAALGIAGQNTVDAVDETKASRKLNKQYPISCKTVFVSHPWVCLKKYAKLTALEETPIFGYAYSLRLPLDFLRLIEEEPKGYAYDIVSGRVYTNDSSFSLSYVALPSAVDWEEVPDFDEVPNWGDLPGSTELLDELDLSPDLLEALSHHMVARTIYSITGDHVDTQLFNGMYKDLIAGTKSHQAQQLQDTFITSNSWIDSRE